MGLANKASFMLVIGTLFITGCTITQKHVEPEQVEPTTDVKPQGQPNPKPRPKSHHSWRRAVVASSLNRRRRRPPRAGQTQDR